MRTPLHLICIAIAVFTLSACQKEFEDPVFTVVPPASSLDTFRVDVDGSAFPAYAISTAKSLNVINLVTSDVQAVKKVSLSFPADIATGSYPLDFSGTIYFGTFYPDAYTLLVSDPGTITILSNNPSTKRIRGTFDFNAVLVNTVAPLNVLNNGYFSVTYH